MNAIPSPADLAVAEGLVNDLLALHQLPSMEAPAVIKRIKSALAAARAEGDPRYARMNFETVTDERDRLAKALDEQRGHLRRAIKWLEHCAGFVPDDSEMHAALRTFRIALAFGATSPRTAPGGDDER
jgi:acyl-CoA reductase-like NAD-dependent aldehyde dehydrogenase